MNIGQNLFSIKTVSISNNKVESIGGFQVVPDYKISPCPTDYGALILIGGISWNIISLYKWATYRVMSSPTKKLGEICGATTFLGAIDILNYAAHTGRFKGIVSALYANEKIISVGKLYVIITLLL